jgi:hypothetical protein
VDPIMVFVSLVLVTPLVSITLISKVCSTNDHASAPLVR